MPSASRRWKQCGPTRSYVATGGAIGPGTVQAIERMLAAVAAIPDALLVSAIGANAAGERFAVRHAQLAAAGCVGFVRLRPTAGADWNDMLIQESAP